jgi:16S rRNA (cytidine1402-2'-O)-methyltransferase
LLHGRTVSGTQAIEAADRRVLEVLLGELPLKQAAALASKITGVPKNRLYDLGLELKNG